MWRLKKYRTWLIAAAGLSMVLAYTGLVILSKALQDLNDLDRKKRIPDARHP